MPTFSRKLLIALAEIGFIVFLFYTNLLMGQFTRSRSAAHVASMIAALYDVFTPANALIGLIGAIVGYFVLKESGNDCCNHVISSWDVQH